MNAAGLISGMKLEICVINARRRVEDLGYKNVLRPGCASLWIVVTILLLLYPKSDLFQGHCMNAADTDFRYEAWDNLLEIPVVNARSRVEEVGYKNVLGSGCASSWIAVMILLWSDPISGSFQGHWVNAAGSISGMKLEIPIINAIGRSVEELGYKNVLGSCCASSWIVVMILLWSDLKFGSFQVTGWMLQVWFQAWSLRYL